jgi:hypothetical protein
MKRDNAKKDSSGDRVVGHESLNTADGNGKPEDLADWLVVKTLSSHRPDEGRIHIFDFATLVKRFGAEAAGGVLESLKERPEVENAGFRGTGLWIEPDPYYLMRYRWREGKPESEWGGDNEEDWGNEP